LQRAFNTKLYLVGDAAFTLSDIILVPFVGSQRDDPTQDAFTFSFTAEEKNRKWHLVFFRQNDVFF